MVVFSSSPLSVLAPICGDDEGLETQWSQCCVDDIFFFFLLSGQEMTFRLERAEIKVCLVLE